MVGSGWAVGLSRGKADGCLRPAFWWKLWPVSQGVWGAIHQGGELVVVDGAMNRHRYIQILRNQMLPWATGVFGRNYILQQVEKGGLYNGTYLLTLYMGCPRVSESFNTKLSIWYGCHLLEHTVVFWYMPDIHSKPPLGRERNAIYCILNEFTAIYTRCNSASNYICSVIFGGLVSDSFDTKLFTVYSYTSSTKLWHSIYVLC